MFFINVHAGHQEKNPRRTDADHKLAVFVRGINPGASPDILECWMLITKTLNLDGIEFQVR